MFAWQLYGTKPDIMTMAKAIGSGVPVGAFAMTKAVAEASLKPGDHGTTYGEIHLPVRRLPKRWKSMKAEAGSARRKKLVTTWRTAEKAGGRL